MGPRIIGNLDQSAIEVRAHEHRGQWRKCLLWEPRGSGTVVRGRLARFDAAT